MYLKGRSPCSCENRAKRHLSSLRYGRSVLPDSYCPNGPAALRAAEESNIIQGTTVDGCEVHFAPPKKPRNDDSLVNANQEWCPMISKWCEMEFVYPQHQRSDSINHKAHLVGSPRLHQPYQSRVASCSPEVTRWLPAGGPVGFQRQRLRACSLGETANALVCVGDCTCYVRIRIEVRIKGQTPKPQLIQTDPDVRITTQRCIL